MDFLKNFIMKTMSKKLITHDGSFHTDDIFAAATLAIYLEKKSETFSAKGGPASGWEIIRTRDPEIIKSGDYVFDVGGVYDADKNKFDHHQVGGAGRRPAPPQIEYASFGLVWKKFGTELCSSQKAVDLVDKKLVAPVDAGDNGIDLFELKSEVGPYLIQNAFSAFVPNWENTNDESLFSGFLECVEMAKVILQKEIILAESKVEAADKIIKIYQNTDDKRIIVLDQKYPYEEIVAEFPEPFFVVYPRADGFWGAKAQRQDPKSFKNRKDFPKSWAGLRDEEMAKISGVADAIFCHRGLFMAVAKSKEGAIRLAQIALEANNLEPKV